MKGYRKYSIAVACIVISTVAAFVLPVWEPWAWLREYTVNIFTLGAGVGAAFITGQFIQNTINGRRYGPPEGGTNSGV